MNGNLPFDGFNKSNDSNSFDKFKVILEIVKIYSR